MRILARLIVVALVIAVSPQILPGVRVGGFGAALIAALVYGLLFVFIGWLVAAVVAVLSLVPGILTLGLFFLLVPVIANTILLKMTAGMLTSFDIGSWSSAFLLSLILSLVNLVLDPAGRRRFTRRPE